MTNFTCVGKVVNRAYVTAKDGLGRCFALAAVLGGDFARNSRLILRYAMKYLWRAMAEECRFTFRPEKLNRWGTDLGPTQMVNWVGKSS